MAITFVTKYPAALTDAAWQKKKSFKDKTKAKTKTGLGAALTLAEKDWGKIDFKKLVADTKILADKNTRQLETAVQQAKDYLDGPVVKKAITSLDAAVEKAEATGKSQALSTTAAKAATALAGSLKAQADLLRGIKLIDFDAKLKSRAQIGIQLEQNYRQAYTAIKGLGEDFKRATDTQTWTNSNLGALMETALKSSKDLADQTGDPDWQRDYDRWRSLSILYTATNRIIQANPGVRAESEMKTFGDLIYGNDGGMTHRY